MRVARRLGCVSRAGAGAGGVGSGPRQRGAVASRSADEQIDAIAELRQFVAGGVFEFLAAIGAVSLGRLETPSDVARRAAFLISDAA